jgi:hypothetical protein
MIGASPDAAAQPCRRVQDLADESQEEALAKAIAILRMTNAMLVASGSAPMNEAELRRQIRFLRIPPGEVDTVMARVQEPPACS